MSIRFLNLSLYRLPLVFAALLLTLLPNTAWSALVCEAVPANEGSANEAGTPGPLRYYQPTASVSVGASIIPLNNTSGLATGDMILVIQMQGAQINSTDNDSYGDGVSGGNAAGATSYTAGRYEYAAVASVAGTTVTLTRGLTYGYVRAAASGSAGQSRYQVIRVPQYDNLTLSGNLTAPAWDGETGGVLPLDVANTLNFNGYSINLNGRGFRGGGGLMHTGRSGATNADYRNTSSSGATGAHGSKGEGAAGTPRYVYNGSGSRVDTGVEGYPNGSYGRGAPGNAAGGGTDGNPSANDQNSGGGGGGNGGAGARGGNSWSSNLAVGGFGGAAFPAAANRLVLGGGGGAASANNASTLPPHGGVGGGIVLIRANQLSGSGTINANGSNGTTPVAANDGGGGGGAGGSVLVLANSQTGSLTINARGGVGGNADPSGQAHGPGGGGGGGVVYINSSFSASINTTQGASGTTAGGGHHGGDSAGSVGSGVTNTDPDLIDGISPGSACAIRADLTINKSRSSGLLQAGSSGQFRLLVENLGPDTATSQISITDVLDSRFSYSGFSGAGWSCNQSPAQTLSCSHPGPLANGAALPELFIDVAIAASAGSNQSVSNTATVSLAATGGNTEPNLANNSSTINDTIYGSSVSGNKRLYTIPATTTTGTLTRTVPTSNTFRVIPENNTMVLNLAPALSDNLVINGDVAVALCLRRSGGDTTRNVYVSLRRASNNSQIGSNSNTQSFSSTAWNWYTFTIGHTGPSTVTSSENLRLIVHNNSSGRGTQTTDLESNGANNNGNCAGKGPSRIELDTSTVINIDSVGIYNAAFPAGSQITSTVEGATVYVRSTVSDPFGHADINDNSVVHVLDAFNNVVSGPHTATTLSGSGAIKQFEYALTMPADRTNGPFTLRATANEGTEGTVSHVAATGLTLTDPPLLMLSKLSSQTNASPGDDIDYQVIVSNNHILGTGTAHGVVVSDKLPQFTALHLGSILFTDGPSPFSPSTLSVAVIEYSNNDGASWAYTPVSGGGGAAAGYDANITHFRVSFNGVMPAGGGFRLDYSLQLQ